VKKKSLLFFIKQKKLLADEISSKMGEYELKKEFKKRVRITK